jgi:hypothetical protein
MEKYSYIIIGIIALIFNIYKKQMKKKKEAEIAMQKQQQEKQRQRQQHKQMQKEQVEEEDIFPTDFLENFDKNFEQTEDDYIPKTSTNEKTYKLSDLENILKKNSEVKIEKEKTFKQQIENYDVDNKTIIKPKKDTKNNVKINLKQAIIYNTILEKKY